MAVTDKKSWKQLRKHAVKTGNLHLSELFIEDPDRFNRFSIDRDQLLLDFSKQRISKETIGLLCSLARECDLAGWIEKLFSGETVNNSEKRAALHCALRLPAGEKLQLDGEDIVAGGYHRQYRCRWLRPGPVYGQQSPVR